MNSYLHMNIFSVQKWRKCDISVTVNLQIKSAGCTAWQQQEERTRNTFPWHTWGVPVCWWRRSPVLWKWPAGGGTPAPAAMTACPSSCSLPTPALGQEGSPGWSWPSWYIYRVSTYLLLRCCCSSRLLHRKWLMPPQSHRKKSGVPPALQRTWASSADGVCSDLSCMLLQCDQSGPAYFSWELRGTCKMSPSQRPFPGWSGLFLPAEIHHQLWSSWHWAGCSSAGTSPQSP